jgi:hypothetical protein
MGGLEKHDARGSPLVDGDRFVRVPDIGLRRDVEDERAAGDHPSHARVGDLRVHEPTGMTLDMISHERARYFQYTDIEYTQAHIRPDGPTLDVQIAQSIRIQSELASLKGYNPDQAATSTE